MSLSSIYFWISTPMRCSTQVKSRSTGLSAHCHHDLSESVHLQQGIPDLQLHASLGMGYDSDATQISDDPVGPGFHHLVDGVRCHQSKDLAASCSTRCNTYSIQNSGSVHMIPQSPELERINSVDNSPAGESSNTNTSPASFAVKPSFSNPIR